MEFEKKQDAWAGWLGWALGLIVFSSVVFFVLFFSGGLPASWGFLHIAGISAVVAGAGSLLKRWLG